MIDFEWDDLKNQSLKEERGVSFEDILDALNKGKLLDIRAHPNTTKYPHQKILVVEINGYAYVAPFIEDKDKIFLKTIYPSRKATKELLKK